MEAYQSDFEQDLLCESVERSEPEWETQNLIRLHLLVWAFELNVVKLYTIDLCHIRRPLVTS